ncbi:Ca2+-binding RTX toxin-like protein [Pseudomonas fluvialis]|uniref:Ca2+-binding RTX toxin-like protein n=1 Tax=Pseudomonas fluvialis TaxID=1793966 RepID=A0A7X0ETA7_9PSED|nr:Ca2+-binding RTX toxin-like protein [Pseudomonas fluvialis]
MSWTLGANLERLTLTGTAAINATGNNRNNVLIGNANANTISGRDGDDTINGGAGADTLIGGLGNDLYVIDNTEDTIEETTISVEEIDTAWSFVDWSLGENLENLLLVGSAAINGIGNSKDNRIIGNAAANVIDGGDGNDFIDGGMGTAPQGSEEKPNEDDVLSGDAGNDTIYGQEGNDVLYGGEGNDSLYGGDDEDTLYALDQYTLSDTTGEINTLIGGDGGDEYVILSANDRIIENADHQGIDRAYVNFNNYSLGENIENLYLGHNVSVAINASGNSLNNVLIGNTNDNTLSGKQGHDSIEGREGNDIIIGDEGNDSLHGGDGSDTLQGGAGNDYLDGGKGNDTFLFGHGDGADVIAHIFDPSPSGESNTLQFKPGVLSSEVQVLGRTTSVSSTLYLTIAGSNDRIAIWSFFADSGPSGPRNPLQFVRFESGEVWDIDELKARALAGSDLDDTRAGTASADSMDGLAGNDYLDGREGNDSLIGGLGNDTLAGLEGNDWLSGGSGNDSLAGHDGSDVLIGGTGNDTLFGSIGSDSYFFARGDGVDTLYDIDSSIGNADSLSFDNVDHDQLWFRSVGSNLEISVIGTDDKITVFGWNAGTSNQIEKFIASDGLALSNAQVANLVNAMAAFSPPAAGQTSLPSNYHAALDPVISASWQP